MLNNRYYYSAVEMELDREELSLHEMDPQNISFHLTYSKTLFERSQGHSIHSMIIILLIEKAIHYLDEKQILSLLQISKQEANTIHEKLKKLLIYISDKLNSAQDMESTPKIYRDIMKKFLEEFKDVSEYKHEFIELLNSKKGFNNGEFTEMNDDEYVGEVDAAKEWINLDQASMEKRQLFSINQHTRQSDLDVSQIKIPQIRQSELTLFLFDEEQKGFRTAFLNNQFGIIETFTSRCLTTKFSKIEIIEVESKQQKLVSSYAQSTLVKEVEPQAQTAPAAPSQQQENKSGNEDSSPGGKSPKPKKMVKPPLDDNDQSNNNDKQNQQPNIDNEDPKGRISDSKQNIKVKKTNKPKLGSDEEENSEDQKQSQQQVVQEESSDKDSYQIRKQNQKPGKKTSNFDDSDEKDNKPQKIQNKDKKCQQESDDDNTPQPQNISQPGKKNKPIEIDF